VGTIPKPFGTQKAPFTIAPKILAPLADSGGNSVTSFLHEAKNKSTAVKKSKYFKSEIYSTYAEIMLQ
jgi:hypothetical protein